MSVSLFGTYLHPHSVHDVWMREALTKVHCSTDQVCTDVTADGQIKYQDPRTGEPINFNFLPTYASSGLGVMPHTVQVHIDAPVHDRLVFMALACRCTDWTTQLLVHTGMTTSPTCRTTCYTKLVRRSETCCSMARLHTGKV